MAKNDDSYEFAEVKAQDIMAERERLWGAFTNATKWSIIVVVVLLVLLYLFWG
ncbi:MAG: aa3-type cytochrome c oxidase subunit IV [Rubritepida sp.]|nr:aa3-type cytochrome c oxidase subunit IV [Rubritepida sp.]